jgi:hypothetical protein
MAAIMASTRSINVGTPVVVGVWVAVEDAVGVLVGVGVESAVAVGVGVRVGVRVGADVQVGVGVRAGVGVGKIAQATRSALANRCIKTKDALFSICKSSCCAGRLKRQRSWPFSWK